MTCIIGAGITGLSALLLLQESGADMSQVTIIDPYFDGGDLARKWTAVLSNTPWSKTINALNTTCPSLKLEPHSNLTKLVDIAHLLKKLTSGLKFKRVQGVVSKASYSSETQTWTLDIGITAKRLIFAQGSEPKRMDISVPSIPLEIALDSSRLQHFIKPAEKVLVFGTMHSGTLVIRNLVSAGAQVAAYYNSPEPFYWARDGVYDGIKEEAATIADDIVAGNIPVELVPVKDTSKVIRTSHSADWVVYAMGFQPRTITTLVDGVEKSSLPYDGNTGRLEIPAAWGFGIAYPNAAPDGNWDVSVAAFLQHMKQQIPNILSS